MMYPCRVFDSVVRCATDRPLSIRNRCIIDVLGAFCVVNFFSVSIRVLVIGLSQKSFFFSVFDSSHFSHSELLIRHCQL